MKDRIRVIIVCVILILFIGLVDYVAKDYYIQQTISKSLKTVKHEKDISKIESLVDREK